MLRTVITPDNSNIHLLIPNNYIGRKLEVLLYAIDELKEEQPLVIAKKRKPSDYAGCISKETAEAMLKNIEQSRNEWERNI